MLDTLKNKSVNHLKHTTSPDVKLGVNSIITHYFICFNKNKHEFLETFFF